MGKKIAVVIPELPESIQTILCGYSKQRNITASLKQRSTIILLAAEGYQNQEISRQVGLHYNNVAIWRKRFAEALPRLKEIENEHPEELEEEICKILSDEAGRGRKKKFTQEQITKIIDLACKSPMDFGYEVSHWSLPMLVKEVKKQGIAEQISVGAVYSFLKSGKVETAQSPVLAQFAGKTRGSG